MTLTRRQKNSSTIAAQRRYGNTRTSNRQNQQDADTGARVMRGVGSSIQQLVQHPRGTVDPTSAASEGNRAAVDRRQANQSQGNRRDATERRAQGNAHGRTWVRGFYRELPRGGRVWVRGHWAQ